MSLSPKHFLFLASAAEGRSSAGGEEEQEKLLRASNPRAILHQKRMAMKAKRLRNNMFFVERGESCYNRIGQSGDEVSSDSPQFGLLAC